MTQRQAEVGRLTDLGEFILSDTRRSPFWIDPLSLKRKKLRTESKCLTQTSR